MAKLTASISFIAAFLPMSGSLGAQNGQNVADTHSIATLFVAPRGTAFLRVVRPDEIERISCKFVIPENKWGRAQLAYLKQGITERQEDGPPVLNIVNARFGLKTQDEHGAWAYIGSFDYGNGESFGILNGRLVGLSSSAYRFIVQWALGPGIALHANGENCRGI